MIQITSCNADSGCLVNDLVLVVPRRWRQSSERRGEVGRQRSVDSLWTQCIADVSTID